MRRTVMLLLLCLLVAVACLAPFAWMVVTSLKPPAEVTAVPPVYWPSDVQTSSYRDVFEKRPFARFLVNSLRVSLGTALLTVALAALAAYPIARGRLRGAAWVERALLVGAVFPPIVLVAPLYELAWRTGALNRPGTLVIVYTALNLPFAVWSLAGYFRSLPTEIEDAALVDGFSRFGLLTRIVLPLSAPGFATTGLLVLVFAWNEFLLAWILMPHELARTVPVGIAMLTGVSEYEVPWDQISAAVVVTTLPVVALVLFAQRRIVEGLTAGGVKG